MAARLLVGLWDGQRMTVLDTFRLDGKVAVVTGGNRGLGRAFARAVGEMPQVLRADAVSGADDVLLHVAAAGTADLQDVLRALPRIGARRATTMLRLGPVKEQSPTPLSPSPTSGATRR